MKAHPLTAEYARFGSFDQLAENNNKQLRELIEGVAAQKNAPGSIADKIATMYNSAMDSVSLNKQGIEPIREDLQRIDACYDKEELFRLYSSLQLKGISGMFGFYIDADIKDSKNNLLQIMQSGLVMGQKEYYLDTDSATTTIREAYKKYMADLFKRCGVAADAEAAARVDGVLALETRLARISRSNTELRDDEKNYNKMTFEELLRDYPGIDWKYYLQHPRRQRQPRRSAWASPSSSTRWRPSGQDTARGAEGLRPLAAHRRGLQLSSTIRCARPRSTSTAA